MSLEIFRSNFKEVHVLYSVLFSFHLHSATVRDLSSCSYVFIAVTSVKCACSWSLYVCRKNLTFEIKRALCRQLCKQFSCCS
jgi:hypothetical protein